MSTATTTKSQNGRAPATGRRRLGWIVAALALQAGLVGLAVAPQLSARVVGDEYRLLVGPVDPIDPFRGAYVDLAYPALQPPPSPDGNVHPEFDQARDGIVYLPLVRDETVPGGVWKSTSIDPEPPASGPYLRCENDWWRLRCGIESWFVPQGRALEIERTMLGDGAVAVVRIDGRGNAAIVDLQPASVS